MTQTELNTVLLKFYKTEKEVPGYVILPMGQFLQFKKINNIESFDTLITHNTKLGQIYVEGNINLKQLEILPG